MLQQARHLENFAKRRVTNHEKLAFFHNCIRNNLPPKSSRRKPLVDTLEGHAAVHQFQTRMMYVMINDRHRQINAQTLRIRECCKGCHTVLSNEHFNMIDHEIHCRAKSMPEKDQYTQAQNRGVKNTRKLSSWGTLNVLEHHH